MAYTYTAEPQDERLLHASQTETQQSPDASIADVASLLSGNLARAQRHSVLRGVGQTYGNAAVQRMLGGMAGKISRPQATAVLPLQRDDDDEQADEPNESNADADTSTTTTPDQSSDTDSDSGDSASNATNNGSGGGSNTDSGDGNTGSNGNTNTDSGDGSGSGDNSTDSGASTDPLSNDGDRGTGEITAANDAGDVDVSKAFNGLDDLLGNSATEADAKTSPQKAITIDEKGLTVPNYSGSFKPVGEVTTAGTSCNGCKGPQCQHVKGTQHITYTANPRVSLPSVPSGLSKCQQDRVKDALDNQLAPHEQQHVDIFNTFTGSEDVDYDMDVCASDYNKVMKAQFQQKFDARTATTNAASDKIDTPPFMVNVNLDC